MTTYQLTEEYLKKLEVIPSKIVKKRISKELQKLYENCSLISIELDENNKETTGHPKPVVNIYDNSNGLIYSIILNSNYPFRPPKVQINFKPYYEFLRIGFLPFLENLKKINKINCLCCSTITCENNWCPGFTTNDVINEIRKFKGYKCNLIKKLFADKIKLRYLINDIDLDCWLF